MKKPKKLKTVIMKPSRRQGAWLHGTDKNGFSVVVPVSCVGKLKSDLPDGFREYNLSEDK